MGLEDQFYSRDNSLITKIDTSLIKGISGIAKDFQYLTGASHEQMLHGLNQIWSTTISATCALIAVNQATESPTLSGLLLLCSAPVYYTFSKVKQKPITQIEEENSLEYKNLNKNSLKYWRLGLATIAGIGAINYGFPKEVHDITSTIAISSILINNYLQLANIPPPNKPFWKRKLEEYFQADLVPIPIDK